MMIIFQFFLVWFLLKLSKQYDDYKSHPCMRSCSGQTEPMLCEYEFYIEWYQVLSKACLNCPFNVTHCSYKDCVSANGIERPIMVVNHMLPGPAIHVCLGDEIQVRVHNKLHMFEGTSLHWHGLHQRKTPFMDGVSMITQCPINSQSYFDYRFQADSLGTYFWHSHSGIQRADGVFGPLIVHEPTYLNPYSSQIDDDLPEHVIVVNDWSNLTAISVFTGYFHDESDNNEPRLILVNGKGAVQGFKDSQGNVYETPRAEFRVKFGRAYRFRLISSGILFCPIVFSIDSHNLTIIASDGKFLEARTVESLVIYAGERYDFILNATQKPKSYWIKARGHINDLENKIFETAILKYENDQEPALLKVPTFEETLRRGLQLNPFDVIINPTNRNRYLKIDEMRSIGNQTDEVEYILDKIKAARSPKQFYFGIEFEKKNNPEFENEQTYSIDMLIKYKRNPIYTPQINNISMETPFTPVLYNWNRIPRDSICNHLDRKDACPNTNEFCSCIYTLEFNLGEVVEMIFVDQGINIQSNHPIHLHGHSFAILGMAKLNQTIKVDDVELLDKQGKLMRNFDNPPLKDTVVIPIGGYTIFRFVADNPGTWMLHCHLEMHLRVGMSILIKVGSLDDLPKPPLNWPQCGNFDVST